MAGQSEIVKIIRATVGIWQDVFYLEWKIKNGLWSLAVFTRYTARSATTVYAGFTAVAAA